MSASRIGLLMLPLVMSACSRVGSERFDTDEILVEVLVSSYASTRETEVVATIEAGDETLALIGGDVLKSIGNGQIRVLGPETTEDGFTGVYSTVFDFSADAMEIAVALEREIDKAASGSTVTVPSEFAIQDDYASVPSLSGSTDIIWSPATTDAMNLELSGKCLVEPLSIEMESPSEGAYTVNGEDWNIASTAGETCVITITLTRYTEGTLDSTLAGGWIKGEQVRSLNVEFSN